MGLYDRINSQIEKSQNIHSRFISLRDIYIHLKNHRPEASSQDILQAFDAEYRTLDQKPELYTWDGNSMYKVGAYVQFGSKPTSFEDLGKNLPITWGRVIAQIKDDPINHQSAKIYGFDRCELNMAMDTDFPEAPCELRDYKAENAEFKNQIAELQDVIRQMEPSPHAERHATKKADVLSALLSLLYRPDFYVDIEDMQRKIKSGVPVLDLIRDALPSQTRLAELLDEKSPLFWPKTGKPPLALRTVESHISIAINRVKKAK